MKRSIVIFTPAFFLLAFLSACASTPPYQAYPDPPKPSAETALFQFPGNGAYGLMLYKVDGKPHTEHLIPGLVEGTYTNNGMCGFDVTLLPGEHSFELYTVDTNPLTFTTIRFTVEAGKTYLMKGNSKAYSVTVNGNPVDVAHEQVPVIAEPAETDFHAVLSFTPGSAGMDVSAYVLRIDGKIRNPMFKLHPRWAVMNYSGLARGIVTSAGGTGTLIQANLDAKEGAFSIRLAPGPHTIEYFAEATVLGSRGLGMLVKTISLDAKAGGRYAIVTSKNAGKDERGDPVTTVEIVQN